MDIFFSYSTLSASTGFICAAFAALTPTVTRAIAVTVKPTSRNGVNYEKKQRDVDVHFRVNLAWPQGDNLFLDASAILWKRNDVPDDEFKVFNFGSIYEMFLQ